MKSRVCTFAPPTILAEPAAAFHLACRDHESDAALTQRPAVSYGVESAIGVGDPRFLKRTAADTANQRIRINERQQPRDVVGICVGQDCDDRYAVGVCEDVVLRTEPGTIRADGLDFCSSQRRARTTNRPQRMTDRFLLAVQSPPISFARAEAQASRQMAPANFRVEHQQNAIGLRAIGHTWTPEIALRTTFR